MRRIGLILLLLPLVMGFTGPLFDGPKIVCYVLKLSGAPYEPVDLPTRLSYNTSLDFSIENFMKDPLVPETLTVDLDLKKYRPDFFKKDRIYTIVAEKFEEWEYHSAFPFGCFYSPGHFTTKYKVINLVTTE